MRVRKLRWMDQDGWGRLNFRDTYHTMTRIRSSHAVACSCDRTSCKKIIFSDSASFPTQLVQGVQILVGGAAHFAPACHTVPPTSELPPVRGKKLTALILEVTKFQCVIGKVIGNSVSDEQGVSPQVS